MLQRILLPLAMLLSLPAQAATVDRFEQVEATVGELEFRDCALTAQHRRRYVQCALLTVPEDYSRPSESRFELFVARLPATSARASDNPLLAIAGGPGEAASESFLWLDFSFQKLNQRRDIYLVDQRGTGLSNPQSCDLTHRQDLLMAQGRESFKALGEECLAQLDGDPRQYTTAVALEDLERVRQALGIRQWNLYGVSYGTRVVQAYLRRYPSAIRSAVMDGVLPADESLGPQIALNSQAALEALFDQCEASTGCRAAYPDLEAGLYGLLASLEEAPASVRYREPDSGLWRTDTLTRAKLVSVIRMALYNSRVLAVLPPVVARAYRHEDYGPLVKLADRLDVSRHLAMGMHNSVVCAEDVPFLESVPEKALQRTYMGPDLVEALRGLCDAWPVDSAPASFKEPVRSSVPTLLLSGERDPITPPAYGERVKNGLENGRHLIVPERGHHVGTLGCVPDIVAQFVETASPEALSVDCVERLTAVPLFLDANGPGP